MKYANLLTNAVVESQLTYGQIIQRCAKFNVKFSAPYLSKLCNGYERPASDEINKALAKVLNIPFSDITRAKYKEMLAPDVFEILGSVK